MHHEFQVTMFLSIAVSTSLPHVHRCASKLGASLRAWHEARNFDPGKGASHTLECSIHTDISSSIWSTLGFWYWFDFDSWGRVYFLTMFVGIHLSLSRSGYTYIITTSDYKDASREGKRFIMYYSTVDSSTRSTWFWQNIKSIDFLTWNHELLHHQILLGSQIFRPTNRWSDRFL